MAAVVDVIQSNSFAITTSDLLLEEVLLIAKMSSVKIFAACALLAAVAAEYHGHGGYGAHVPILRYDNVNNGDGTYRYNYETGNGISAHESGAPRAAGPEGPAVTAEGGFSYRAPDGQQISLTYTADENGFHPVGSHIPTPPPIPDAILRSLQYNRQHPSSDNGNYNSGSYNSGRYNTGYHY